MLNSLHYAFYLACSWLWCLGGFFPLILGRDYGWPALAAFTIFNVGGAMAMAFYFRNPQQQVTFEHTHKPIITLFSYITIAYQVFFIGWLSFIIEQPLIVIAMFTIALIIYLSKQVITYWAIVFYLLSIGLLVSFVGYGYDYGLPTINITPTEYWPHSLLPLAIGFIFSPYLDITFHRAYKHSKKPILSFTIGFGVLFLSLLCFVFLYAGSLSDIFFKHTLPTAIIYPVIVFLVLQTAFTIAAHCSELNIQFYIKPEVQATTIFIFTILVMGCLLVINGNDIPWFNLLFEETLYKSFLFFYSLVFPLYLLVGKSKRGYLWVLALCTPAYSIGFLYGGEYSYSLSIGVSIIILAVLFKRRSDNLNKNKETTNKV